jgi:hypothetical protein
VRAADDLPPNTEALILLTLEELAVNELREPCHHWVRTVALPVKKGALGEPLPHRPPTEWQQVFEAGAPDTARSLWENVEDHARTFVENLQRTRTSELAQRLTEAGKRVAGQGKQRFEKRRKELDKAISDNQIAKLEKEIEFYLRTSAFCTRACSTTNFTGREVSPSCSLASATNPPFPSIASRP